MNTKQYIDRSSGWLPERPGAGIAVSSRIRLARNLRDDPFPGWAGESECTRIWEQLRDVLLDCPALGNAQAVAMEKLSTLDKLVLFERHLISREQAERKQGAGAVIRDDEVVAVMVNEEDHLRLQCILPGLAIEQAWDLANQLDTEIEAHVDYAFTPKLGYLTACPSNVGTGMRVSVMLHVPGLVLMNEINAVIKGMARIGLAVRGLWGEGSESTGNMYQVSNQMTLGEGEDKIVDNFGRIVQEIIEHEQHARWRLFETNEALVHDRAGRALGILLHAHILTSKEVLDLLSDLRLGIDMGIVKLKTERIINDLLILTQPGHLQKVEGRRLKTHERDVARALLVRSRMNAALYEQE